MIKQISLIKSILLLVTRTPDYFKVNYNKLQVYCVYLWPCNTDAWSDISQPEEIAGLYIYSFTLAFLTLSI